jgi:predicted double-glycine peptidase
MSALRFALYKQTSDFSCGAASLVMALHALRGRPLSRSEEFEHWRVGTMIGVPGMDQWGLALAARTRGIPATVISPTELTFRMEDFKHPLFTPELVELAAFAQLENRARAQAAGVEWQRRMPALEDIEGSLQSGRAPVLLVDLHTLSKGADSAPHWVVPARFEADAVTVHDPAAEGPGERVITRAELWEAMDVGRYQAERTLVVLGP